MRKGKRERYGLCLSPQLKRLNIKIRKERTRNLFLERMLESEEKKHKDILFGIADYLVVIDVYGNIVQVSKEMRSLLGFSSKELIGEDVFSYVEKTSKERIKNELELVKKNKYSLHDLKVQAYDYRNEVVTIYVTIIPKITSGEVEGFYILEKKRLNNGGRSKESDDITFSILAHEFKRYLSGISVSAEILEQYIDVIKKEEREENLKDIIDNVFYMNEIVDFLMLLSKYGNGYSNVGKETIDLKLMVDDVVITLKKEYIDSPNCILNKIKNIQIYTNRVLLRQIITNLISNAIKHTSKEKNIYITAGKDQKFISIIISDEGCGINSSEIEKVFSPFFIGKSSQGEKGLGLGLYIVKRFTDILGGRVFLKSKVGVGTEVELKFPV